jgi:outer membrane protein assembly factor BamD (BamD/ComL family)
MRKPFSFFIATSCFAVTCLSGAIAQEDDFDAMLEVKPDRKQPSFFRRPAEETPAAQFAYASRLRERGAYDKARRQFDALVRTWPGAPEAPEAQFAVAELLEQDGRLRKAFDEYQYLVDYYAGLFPYGDVLARQFSIARQVMSMRHGKLLFLPGFEAPEQALPLLEKVVENGPRWEKAAAAQFLIGTIHEERREYAEAVVAYEKVRHWFGRTPLAADAAYRRAQCLYETARRSPRDEEACRDALSALAGALARYPDHAEADAARALLDELKGNLADMYYRRAVFYDRMKTKPKAALIAYTDFMKKFPWSDKAVEVNGRIEELKAQLEEEQ